MVHLGYSLLVVPHELGVGDEAVAVVVVEVDLVVDLLSEVEDVLGGQRVGAVVVVVGWKEGCRISKPRLFNFYSTVVYCKGILYM